jgi:hypothetical protein
MLGSSFRPVEWITVGVAGSRLIGSIDKRTEITFPTNSPLTPATYANSTLFAGWGYRAGVRLNLLDNALRIGGTFESSATLEREQHLISVYQTSAGFETGADTTSSTVTNMTIPPRITIGASARSGKFLFSGEAGFQSWDQTEFASAPSSSRFAIGVDRLADDATGATGFNTWDFRIGGYMEKTYYAPLGEGIDQVGGTIGASIPLRQVTGLNVGTTLNVALEVGSRGTTDHGLTSEMFGRFVLELNVGELWFTRVRK